MKYLIYFKENYLGYIWLVGLIFGVILLVGFIVEKYKYHKFVKQKEAENAQRIEKLKQKSL